MNGGTRFGARFRAARLARGLSQDALADALGITKAAISQWELGNKAPRFDLWAQIRRVLAVPIDALILDDPPAFAAVTVRDLPSPTYTLKPTRLQRLAAMFGSLDDAQQRALLDLAKLFTQQNARHADDVEDARLEHDPAENYDPGRDDD